MWYICILDAKQDASFEDIHLERERWIKEGKEKVFQEKCKVIKRYEVIGKSPLKIIFLIQTDDPSILNILTQHFGDTWDAVTYPVIQRNIPEAVKYDHTVIGG
jgi:hypothetical protein